jgi:hypothetical protein
LNSMPFWSAKISEPFAKIFSRLITSFRPAPLYLAGL